jgi:O-antigen ligase
MQQSMRNQFVLLCLALALAAGVAYDTRLVISYEGLRPVFALAMLGSLGLAFVLSKYPVRIISPVIVAVWPLHLLTFAMLFISVSFQRGFGLREIIAYTLVAYATFVLVPIWLLSDRRLFDSFAKLVAVGTALVAIPAFVGALGVDSLIGMPLSNKYSYSEISGIIASGGIFEHAEGMGFQAALGLFCCIYALRVTGNRWYVWCLLAALGALIVSQGRGAIFGVVLAALIAVLPEVFRRVPLLFLGSLAVCLILPFVLWQQMAQVPGIAAYLRIERGLSGRDVAWQYAGSLIEEKPWTGYGFGRSGELSEEGRKVLRRSGYSGAGTTFHNTFITKAVELGMIVAVVYALLYLVPLIRICYPSDQTLQQQLVRSIIVLSLTASIFRDYNIGGVRSTSLIVAVFLGLANLWPLEQVFRSETANREQGDVAEHAMGVPAGRTG